MGRTGPLPLGAGFIVLLITLPYYLSPDTALWIYPLSSILGMSKSNIMVKSVYNTGDLVGTHVESGAFVYGSMSFTDKISNGLAILFIKNTRQQWQDVPQADGAFLRQVYCILPSVASLLGLCTILFLRIEGQDRLPRKVTSAFSSGSDDLEMLQSGSGTSPRYGSGGRVRSAGRGLDSIETKRKIPSIYIQLSLDELDRDDPGYLIPIPADQVSSSSPSYQDSLDFRKPRSHRRHSGRNIGRGVKSEAATAAVERVDVEDDQQTPSVEGEGESAPTTRKGRGPKRSGSNGGLDKKDSGIASPDEADDNAASSSSTEQQAEGERQPSILKS
ncbi:hypothetical protein PsorP6_004491 [Peronosclerospora sorghi]|uniref:Uncharacterized protein n=1 Tax=Peronosclerospora sorghi TaxID=230839 RepID=A0ACC0VRN5_9STRA|nr:hypothetical protein PsorP6_004491 [Peronosclerospora sorghi]